MFEIVEKLGDRLLSILVPHGTASAQSCTVTEMPGCCGPCVRGCCMQSIRICCPGQPCRNGCGPCRLAPAGSDHLGEFYRTSCIKLAGRALRLGALSGAF